MKKLQDVSPVEISYFSVAFGLNKQLFKFWSKNNFKTFYLKHKINEVTGENTCMMLKPFSNFELNCPYFFNDFSSRFLSLLNYDFNHIDLTVSLDMVDANLSSKAEKNEEFEHHSLS